MKQQISERITAVPATGIAPLAQILKVTENAADKISTGGNMVKNYHITINDGLIKQVDNHFSSTGESPESASHFMEKFSSALRMVLHDVDYTIDGK